MRVGIISGVLLVLVAAVAGVLYWRLQKAKEENVQLTEEKINLEEEIQNLNQRILSIQEE